MERVAYVIVNVISCIMFGLHWHVAACCIEYHWEKIFGKIAFWPNEFPIWIILKIYEHMGDLKMPVIEETHWSLTLTCLNFGLRACLHTSELLPPRIHTENQVHLSSLTCTLGAMQVTYYGHGEICLRGDEGVKSVFGASPMQVGDSWVIFLLCSQEPGHCYSCGPGQPSQQPLPEVPQHRTENCHELAADCPQCSSQRLCSGGF